ncbi:Protein FAM75A6 [Heterocephalus glaber]|uniref:Protein FAM75A6 n=1 Tax=Heterocephalus glaber TaxID=10181 RepID=G5B860_HETGA|nr:Protein FAM75A6 [Heterocephalus glaber]
MDKKQKHQKASSANEGEEKQKEEDSCSPTDQCQGSKDASSREGLLELQSAGGSFSGSLLRMKLCWDKEGFCAVGAVQAAEEQYSLGLEVEHPDPTEAQLLQLAEADSFGTFPSASCKIPIPSLPFILYNPVSHCPPFSDYQIYQKLNKKIIPLLKRDKTRLEAVLKAHLDVKVAQIHEGLIPLRVRRSWLVVNGVVATSHTHMGTRTPASSRSQGTLVSTIQKFFSNPHTQQDLEMQSTRRRVRHRWGLPLKLLKAVNAFKSTKAAPSPFPQCARPSSSGNVSWADLTVEDEAKFLGKPPQGCPGEEATVRQSVHTLGSLLVSSISCKETKRALAGIPLGDGRWSSEGPLTRQDSAAPSQQLTSSLMGRTRESRTTQRVGRGSPEVPMVPGTCVTQDAGEPGLWAYTGSKFQHGEETKSVSHCQVCVTGVHLPDCPTDTLCASHRLASPESQWHHHSMPLGDMPAPQLFGDLMADRGSSLGQQKPQIQKLQHSPKSQSKTSVPADKHEVGRSPSSEKHEDRLGDLETSEPPDGGGIEDTLESKHLQLPQKKPVPSEGYFQRSMKKCLQWVLPKKEIKGQEDTQKKGKPAPAKAQSQRPAKNRPRVDHNTDETQRLMTALGQMVEATIMLKHELCAFKFNQHKEEEGHAPISQVPCSSEHRRKPGHAATHKCHSCPTRERHTRAQESLKTGQLNSEQQGQRHPHPSFPIKAVSPVRPSQCGPTVSRAPGQQRYCPRHGPF